MPSRFGVRGSLAALAGFMALSAGLHAAPAPRRAIQPRPAGQRRIPLQGAENFRDVGGYVTPEGRSVRWGKVFRSGELSRLTESDYALLNALGPGLVCDLRRDDERQRQPTRWQGGAAPEILEVPIATQQAAAGSSNWLQQAMAGKLGPAEVQAKMRSSYALMPAASAEQIGNILRRIADLQSPVLLHCTAGKDRTGVVTAILLLTLGVRRQDVLADYLLTNEFLSAGGLSPALQGQGANRLPPELLRPLLAADAGYLESALQAIETGYGSFENYRRTALQVSDVTVAKLRLRLLE